MRNAAPVKYWFYECNADFDATSSPARMPVACQASRFTSSATSSSDGLRAGETDVLYINEYMPRTCEEGQAPQAITAAASCGAGKLYGKLVRRVEQQRPSLGNSSIYSCNTAVWPRTARCSGLRRMLKAAKTPFRAGEFNAQPFCQEGEIQCVLVDGI